MTNWRVEDSRADPLRPSLVERARKRKVKPKIEPAWWSVEGNPTLNDTYPFYDVHLRGPDDFWCSCQSSKGGEYRTTCSHITGVILWRQKNPDPWGQEDRTLPQTPLTPAPKTSNDFLDIKPPAATTLSSMAAINVTGGQRETAGDRGRGEADPPPAFDRQQLAYEPIPTPDQLADPLSDIRFDPTRFPSFRSNQWEAIVDIVEEFEAGTKVVFLDAAPGNGKTIMGEAVRQLLNLRAAYTCTTKDLQDQIMRDFGHYAKILKGRANYPTFDRQVSNDITAADCTKKREALPACVNCPGSRNAWVADTERTHGPHCAFCHPTRNCPYQVAKRQALGARLAVINTPYLLTEGNSYIVEDENLSGFANWDLYVIDEADQLEKILLSYIQVEFGPRTRHELGIGLPEKKTVDDSWIRWIEDMVIPSINELLAENEASQLTIGAMPDVKADRKRKRLEDLRARAMSLLETKTSDDGEEVIELQSGWVLDGWDDKKEEGKITITFKPIWVRDYARKYLWDLGPRFLLMSGTFISPEQVAFNLGLEDDEWAVVSVPSTFPKERRPILLRGQAELNYNNKSSTYPIIVSQVEEIMAAHPDERMLVHSVSYHLANEILRGVRQGRGRLVSYTAAHQRASALQRYLSVPNSVMVAPVESPGSRYTASHLSMTRKSKSIHAS